MKKLMIAAAMMIGLASVANAQQVVTPAPKKVAVKPATTATAAPVAKVNTTATKVVTAKPAVKPVAAPAPATAGKTVVLKKDGTPDKRYKTAKEKVPLKKDGTPDKRFKANKN